MQPYADAEAVIAFISASTEVDETELGRLCIRASELLDSKITATYSVDDDGVPTDTDLALVLSDACCAQVEQWLEVGEENDIDGSAGEHISVTGFSGSRAPELGPRAERILRNNGLLSGAVPTLQETCS